MVKKKGEGQFKGLIRGFGFTLNKPKREPRSQPGAKANKYTCQLALSPADSCTFALTHTQRNTKCTASRLTPHYSTADTPTGPGLITNHANMNAYFICFNA